MPEKARNLPDQRSRVCPHCGALNAGEDRVCYRCGRKLPNALTVGVMGAAGQLFGGHAPVTQGLLAWCVLMSGLCVATDHRIPIWLTDAFSVRTLVRFGGLVGPAGSLEPWRYLGAVFLHVNVLHLGMNGWSLASIGPTAESHFGRTRYLVLFLLSGLLGFVSSSVWYGAFSPPTVGASGAIFGLVGSVVGERLALRDPSWKSILISNLVNLAILALILPVNNAAHIGGLVVGALLGFVFTVERRRFRLGAVFAVLAAILVALIPASLFLSNASQLWKPQPVREFGQEP